MTDRVSEEAKYGKVSEVLEALDGIVPRDARERYLLDEPDWKVIVCLKDELLDTGINGVLGFKSIRETLVFYLREVLVAALYIEMARGYRTLKDGSNVVFDDSYYEFLPDLMMLVSDFDLQGEN